MNGKHSAGPWKAFDNGMGDTRIINNRRLICDCNFEGALDGSQFQANARLISAAPELLKALEALFEHCSMIHKHWGDGCNSKQASAAQELGRAAIRKARGE